MRTKQIFLLMAVVFILIPIGVCAGPKIQHWTTDKGSRTYYVEAPGLPLIDIQIVFDAGSARDGKQHGIASLTAGLLDKGAKDWSANEIAERLDQVGAQLSTGVSRDSSSISLRCLTRDGILDFSLETLTQVINEPAFYQQDFEREKKRVLVGLRHREESPGTIASIKYYQALYGDHPYGHPVSGFIETVESVTRDDVVSFFNQFYRASDATIVIVGDISRQQADAISQSVLAKLPKGKRLPAMPTIEFNKRAAIQQQRFPSQQTHILSGMPVLSRDDPDYIPLYVGNHILGGSGLVSKITEEVREKRGLSYSSYSYFNPMIRKGPFTMGLQTRNDQAQDAYDVLLNTVKEYIKQGPSDDELDRAKKNITGGFVLRYDSNQKLAEYIAMIGFYHLPLDYLDTFPKKVMAISRRDIADAFSRKVLPDLFQTVMVGGEGSKSHP